MMQREDILKFVIPTIVVIVLILSIVILGGLASSNPDGFEWAFFQFANATEPESGFEGMWAFLGEGPMVELFTGAVGVLIVFVLGLVLFKVVAKRE